MPHHYLLFTTVLLLVRIRMLFLQAQISSGILIFSTVTRGCVQQLIYKIAQAHKKDPSKQEARKEARCFHIMANSADTKLKEVESFLRELNTAKDEKRGLSDPSSVVENIARTVAIIDSDEPSQAGTLSFLIASYHLPYIVLRLQLSVHLYCFRPPRLPICCLFWRKLLILHMLL